MAIRSKEEILEAIKTHLGDDVSDGALNLMTDVADTFANFEANSNENWKNKYENNDKEWRRKYRDAFFSEKPAPIEDDEDDSETVKPKRFEDLFTKG